MHPVDALRRAVVLLLALDDAAAFQVARALDDWLAAGGDFAAHAGLAPGWHVALRQRERSLILSELARSHFPGLRGRTFARAVAAAVFAYERRRRLRNAPEARPDGLDGLLFDLLKLGPLPGKEMLRKFSPTVVGHRE